MREGKTLERGRRAAEREGSVEELQTHRGEPREGVSEAEEMLSEGPV